MVLTFLSAQNWFDLHGLRMEVWNFPFLFNFIKNRQYFKSSLRQFIKFAKYAICQVHVHSKTRVIDELTIWPKWFRFYYANKTDFRQQHFFFCFSSLVLSRYLVTYVTFVLFYRVGTSICSLAKQDFSRRINVGTNLGRLSMILVEGPYYRTE